MAANEKLKTFLRDAAARTDDFLKTFLNSLSESPSQLTDSMAYSLFGPGKRIRPALVQLCYAAVAGKGGAGNVVGDFGPAMPAAGAIEMIHCFSLIHDDLPAMDNDDLRRGRPTNHKVYGEGLAILAGDALNTLPFELIATKVGDPVLAVRLIRELSHETGPEGMIGGQVLDSMHPGEMKAGGHKKTLADLQKIHRMKTGALIRCACRMGGLCAGASAGVMESIDSYGRAIGLAFQIVDDILDVTATEEQMGKKTGKDAAIGKLTYPVLVGLDGAKKYLDEQVKIADQVAAKLGAGMLSELAHDLANRTS